MTTRPKCRYCDKPLAKKTFWIDLDIETDPQSIVGTTIKEYQGEIVELVRVGKTRSPLDHRVRQVSYWCGRWGSYGDSFFCCLNCARNWAVKTLRRLESFGPATYATTKENQS